jgi:hypothetical protein
MNKEKTILFFKENPFVITFVFVVSLFLWKFIILKESFLLGDYSVQHIPWSRFLADSLDTLSLPLWTPYMHSGFPILAEGQIGALYPPNLIMYFFLPYKIAYTYSIFLHFVLAGIFMYIYVREIGMSKTAATVTVIAFLFGSGYGGCFYGMMSLRVLVWFPLILFLTEKLFKKEELLYGILIGIVVGVQILAGYLQFALYSIIFSTLYFVVHLYFYHLKYRGLKRSTRVAIFYLIGAFVAFGLSAAQLFATVELSQFSSRQDIGIEFSMLGSYTPLGLIQLLFPRCTFTSGGLLYIGTLPFLLSLVVVFYKKNRFLWFFIFLTFFSLLLAFGKYSPLYVLIIKAIGFYGLRVPAKFLFFTVFSLAILAGYGFDRYCSTSADEKQNTKYTKTIFYLSAGAASILIITNIILFLGKGLLINFGRNYVENNIYGKPFHRHSLDVYYDKVDSVYQALVSNTYIFNPFIISSISILIISFFIIKYIRRWLSLEGFQFTCIAVIIIDLYIFSLFGTGFRGNMAPVKETLKAPGAIEFIKSDTSLHRVYGLIPNKFQDDYARFFPNYNMYYQISDVGAYSPLVMNDYYNFMEKLGGVDDSIWRLEPTTDALNKNLNLLNLLNVKYIITYEEIKDKRVELAYTDEKVNVYRNKGSLPRAFFLSNYKVISDGQEALDFLRSKDFNPKDIVVLNEEPASFENRPESQYNNASVEIKDYSANKVILNINTSSSGILVLSDTFYPGWKAYVDWQETEIMKANTVMRAVIIPKGKHLVRFVYDPVPFNNGLKLGLCTLIGIPIMIFVSNLSKRKKH